tara:strand:+ start:762 stop:1922 length:1161 start_codon:yes stop_codon:yes gene_type:complete
MANQKIPYLVPKGERWYWQPNAALRACGWKPVPLGKDETIARAKAHALNDDVDAWRQAAESQVAPTQAGGAVTVAELIHRYGQTAHYKRLRPNTRRGYAYAFRQIEAWCGDAAVRTLDVALIREWHEVTWKRYPTKAVRLLVALRIVLEHGVEAGLLDANPAGSVSPLQIVTGDRELWTPAEIDHMVATADELLDGNGRSFFSVGTAILLNFWLGQRLNDILRLQTSQILEGRISIQQQKTAARVVLPSHLVAVLSERLAQQIEHNATIMAGQSVQHLTLLVSESTLTPYHRPDDNTWHFSNRFRAVRDAAALTMPSCGSLTFQMLRHTTVTAMADAGCELPEIGAVSGHTLQSLTTILQRYLKPTTTQAENAFAKRLAASQRNPT